ncbi:JAB domain-containing protein [Halioglobus maricola]|uniref:JAB domain-containing protein n=1 Tax=Halioglobus maricola TaxID=2601894 RepID=A0A5P9NQ60_9GAMM|nr:DNA repair protein RadC [Halioglobus maricola]QFU77626.1 JAB domain-containing protein [Halioglobus maricola]
MATSYWEPGEGPRDKLLGRGESSVSDAELLAVLLATGYRDCSALELARAMLSRFGGLGGLLRAGEQELLACPGIGRAKYAVVRASLELARRQALQELERGDVLSSPASTRRFLQHHLGHREREVFSCMFLDNQHRLLRCEDLFQGTLDGAAVYPREVAVRALRYRAAAVIFAHNHPSGVAEPSSADRRITERLVSALGLLDVRVLDHIIVGRGREYSFAEAGLL